MPLPSDHRKVRWVRRFNAWTQGELASPEMCDRKLLTLWREEWNRREGLPTIRPDAPRSELATIYDRTITYRQRMEAW